MKHVVMRQRSTLFHNRPYTCTGFGDMVHSCLLTYLYGDAHHDSATLHISLDQHNRNKPKIWADVMSLFPYNSLFLEVHQVRNFGDRQFFDLVRSKEADAKLHYYRKYPGRFQKVRKPSFFVDDYMKYPCLVGPDKGITLPEKFITMQVDATSKKRRLSKKQLNKIFKKFSKYEIVIVGGKSADPRFRTAPYCGYAMSRAHYHVGVDSGHMHLAQLYFRPQNIFLYVPNRGFSHHVSSAIDHGCKINDYEVLKHL